MARVSIKFKDIVWIEDLQELCLEALNTETQVVVKREDEMAFAELMDPILNLLKMQLNYYTNNYKQIKVLSFE